MLSGQTMQDDDDEILVDAVTSGENEFTFSDIEKEKRKETERKEQEEMEKQRVASKTDAVAHIAPTVAEPAPKPPVQVTVELPSGDDNSPPASPLHQTPSDPTQESMAAHEGPVQRRVDKPIEEQHQPAPRNQVIKEDSCWEAAFQCIRNQFPKIQGFFKCLKRPSDQELEFGPKMEL